MTNGKATTEQVRDFYRRQGYQVRINKDGRVSFRLPLREWMDGRWVSEYVVRDGGVTIR